MHSMIPFLALAVACSGDSDKGDYGAFEPLDSGVSTDDSGDVPVDTDTFTILHTNDWQSHM